MNETSGGPIGGWRYTVSWPQGRYGWICPKCNAGVSPEIQKCPCSYILQGGAVG